MAPPKRLLKSISLACLLAQSSFGLVLPAVAATAATPASASASAGSPVVAPASSSSSLSSPSSSSSSSSSRSLSDDEVRQKAAALKSDIVLRAMQDEMDRSMKSLKLPNYPLPYYGSYSITDEDFLQLTAGFGAVETNNRSVNRYSDVVLRVGDKKLDNSAASGGMLLGRTWAGGSDVVNDDSYDALRYGLWLQTDSAYKAAVESLEAARARLRYLNIEGRPDCFSDARPVVSVVDGVKQDVDANAWAERIRKISAVFKQYPKIQLSHVFMNVRQSTRRFINSEGTLTKHFATGVVVGISASAQCKDGMDLNDYEFFAGDGIDQLPGQAAMEEATHRLCKRLEGLLAATRAEEYQGPVLFEKQAASELAVAVLPRLVCARPDFGPFVGEDEQVLGKPVLASAISVLDDPEPGSFNNFVLKGGWKIDYEGVAAQKLNLVEKGVLKTLCSTRTPTRAIGASNGHCRGGGGTPGHLFLSTDEKNTFADLKNKLIEQGKKDNLDYVLVVRRSQPSFLGGASGGIAHMLSALEGRSRSVGHPILVYRIDVHSGKEELLRGARFKEMPKRGLLDLQLASDDTQPYTIEMPGDRSSTTLSLITPSILVKDIEVLKPGHLTEAPPYLQNPYFEEQGGKKE